jgi:hypothetical protein
VILEGFKMVEVRETKGLKLPDLYV